ncbi:MAG: adenylyl-sulfate kinase [Pseudomonadota bacterium]
MNKLTNQNTVWHEPSVYRKDREQMNQHKSVILWFTGLSGSGKSTMSHALEDVLHKNKVRTYVLDGDNIRQGLCNDLGFSAEDRTENIRRIGEVSKLMMEAGVFVLTAFISPFRKDRRIVRELVAEGEFIEVHCNAALEVCESRDPKGLYKKARAGEISDFTGISSPYEVPENAEIMLDTANQSIDVCIETILTYLRDRAIIHF